MFGLLRKRLFDTDLGHIFVSNVGKNFADLLRGERPCKPETADTLQYALSHNILRPDFVIFCWRHKNPIVGLFSLFLKVKSEDVVFTGQYICT